MLEMERNWSQRELAIRQACLTELEAERKAMVTELEDTLTSINNKHGQQMRNETISNAEQMRADKAAIEQDINKTCKRK